ncbi:hypothetical protein B0H17DRAFT_1225632 [Mycena rosella]|uniref:Uncharacterized protein n=1 Tax=Mycena rosella TaxID=1033263 RepID=A0AAD7B3X0_MYCRO|nr:hypothetical protein B0H17DRAFT_1225632 [Mycena rosella]
MGPAEGTHAILRYIAAGGKVHGPGVIGVFDRGGAGVEGVMSQDHLQNAKKEFRVAHTIFPTSPASTSRGGMVERAKVPLSCPVSRMHIERDGRTRRGQPVKRRGEPGKCSRGRVPSVDRWLASGNFRRSARSSLRGQVERRPEQTDEWADRKKGGSIYRKSGSPRARTRAPPARSRRSGVKRVPRTAASSAVRRWKRRPERTDEWADHEKGGSIMTVGGDGELREGPGCTAENECRVSSADDTDAGATAAPNPRLILGSTPAPARRARRRDWGMRRIDARAARGADGDVVRLGNGADAASAGRGGGGGFELKGPRIEWVVQYRSAWTVARRLTYMNVGSGQPYPSVDTRRRTTIPVAAPAPSPPASNGRHRSSAGRGARARIDSDATQSLCNTGAEGRPNLDSGVWSGMWLRGEVVTNGGIMATAASSSTSSSADWCWVGALCGAAGELVSMGGTGCAWDPEGGRDALINPESRASSRHGGRRWDSAERERRRSERKERVRLGRIPAGIGMRYLTSQGWGIAALVKRMRTRGALEDGIRTFRDVGDANAGILPHRLTHAADNPECLRSGKPNSH